MEAWHRMEALEAYCQLCYHQMFIVKHSRILSEDQIKALFIRHQTGVTEFNKLKGVKHTTNIDQPLKLSEYNQSSNFEFPEEMIGSITSVVIIWQSMKTWNEFLLVLITIDKVTMKPLTLVPFIYDGQYMAQPGAMFAVLALISVPIISLYVFMQRYIISGVTAGAVKG